MDHKFPESGGNAGDIVVEDGGCGDEDLMVEYYQRLLKGEGRSAALREAQGMMINSKTRSHPYYWAAFLSIGDWRPLGQN
ncbi:MAG: hypothetical protein K0S45_4122 [Nitrospira sp.]|jgi:CHAT domain-containing protein|nr:hypothetical protein [Nitrospira sp.]